MARGAGRRRLGGRGRPRYRSRRPRYRSRCWRVRPASPVGRLLGMNASATAPRPRRSPRDWVVDTGLFLLAAGYWVLAVGGRLQADAPPEPAWLFTLDVVAGALGVAALWLRRRWPVGLAVALVALSAFSELVAVAMVVALFTVAVHRPPRTTAFVFASSLLAPLVYVVFRREPGTSGFLLFLLGVAVQGGAVGWGLFVRHRRQRVLSQRDR